MTTARASRRRRADPDDFALWRRATRDVVPLRPRPRGPPSGISFGKARVVRAHSAAKPPPLPQPAEPEQPLDSLAGIDRANAERLRRGWHPVEARLDFHGMTQAEAHAALSYFVRHSQAAGRRCVLVITGRGRLGGGVLRAAVPRWLAEPSLRRHVLGIAPAQPQHGGAGALYLLLRRLRER